MLINRINRTVKAYLNTDNRGNYTKEDFNLFLYQGLLEIYDNYFADLNRYLNRQNRGLISGGISNLPDKISEKIAYYRKKHESSVSSGVLSLPDDYRFLEFIETSGGRLIEITKDASFFSAISRNEHTAPSALYPIAIQSESTLTFAPTNLGEINIYYLREPLKPNWTSRLVSGEDLFDSSLSGFQDIDMHPSEEENLTRLVLLKFGINLKEADVQQIIKAEHREEFQEENTL